MAAAEGAQLGGDLAVEDDLALTVGAVPGAVCGPVRQRALGGRDGIAAAILAALGAGAVAGAALKAIAVMAVEVDAERRRGGEPGEPGAPEGLVGGRVAAPQPGDVVAEAAHRRQVRLAGLRHGRVGGHHLRQHHRRRPGVEEDVVVGPGQESRGLARPHPVEAQQRRLPEIERLPPDRFQELFDALPRLAAALVGSERHRHLAVHHLQRLVEPLPVERGAQRRVARHHPPPGRRQQLGLDAARELEDQLIDVQPLAGRLEAVE